MTTSRWPRPWYKSLTDDRPTIWVRQRWQITDPCPDCGGMETIRRTEGHRCRHYLSDVIICADCGLGLINRELDEKYKSGDVWKPWSNTT